jgi:hypothetical protein
VVHKRRSTQTGRSWPACSRRLTQLTQNIGGSVTSAWALDGNSPARAFSAIRSLDKCCGGSVLSVSNVPRVAEGRLDRDTG